VTGTGLRTLSGVGLGACLVLIGHESPPFRSAPTHWVHGQPPRPPRRN